MNSWGTLGSLEDYFGRYGSIRHTTSLPPSSRHSQDESAHHLGSPEDRKNGNGLRAGPQIRGISVKGP